MRTILILVVFSLAAFGQRHKLEEVDSEKPEGKLLHEALTENDAAKKNFFRKPSTRLASPDRTCLVLPYESACCD